MVATDQDMGFIRQYLTDQLSSMYGKGIPDITEAASLDLELSKNSFTISCALRKIFTMT